MEIWKDIEGFEGRYQVSNLGNVKSLNYGNHGYEKNLIPKINNKGYLWVELLKNNTRKCYLVHRLVAMAFIDNPNGFNIINHKDENPLNCTVENLEWCTTEYNNKYSRDRHPERIKIKPIKISRPYKRHKEHINQLSLNGEFIKQWENLAELAREKKYHSTSIKECCEGKRNKAYGYRWEFAEKSADSLFIYIGAEKLPKNATK